MELFNSYSTHTRPLLLLNYVVEVWTSACHSDLCTEFFIKLVSISNNLENNQPVSTPSPIMIPASIQRKSY